VPVYTVHFVYRLLYSQILGSVSDGAEIAPWLKRQLMAYIFFSIDDLHYSCTILQCQRILRWTRLRVENLIFIVKYDSAASKDSNTVQLQLSYALQTKETGKQRRYHRHLTI
jgi:hypothetical protein